MFRSLFGLMGVLMLAVPRRVVEAAEPLAFENPDEARLRGWTIPMARGEGILYLLLARRGKPPAAVASLLGLFAGFAALSPRGYLRFGLGLAYENPDDLRIRSWVLPGTRVIGLAVLWSVMKAFGRQESSSDESPQT